MTNDTDTDEKWVVTLFFDYEPSEVYGLFDSEEEALMWAESGFRTYGAAVAHMVRSPVGEVV